MIGAYEETVDWDTYAERVKLFLTANRVTENKQVPCFLSVIGGTEYGILKLSYSPDLPAIMTLDQLTTGQNL